MLSFLFLYGSGGGEGSGGLSSFFTIATMTLISSAFPPYRTMRLMITHFRDISIVILPDNRDLHAWLVLEKESLDYRDLH